MSSPEQNEDKLGANDLLAQFCRDLVDPESTADIGTNDAKGSLLAYCRLTMDGHYQDFPHTAMLIKKLEAIERGEISRLMVFMPPRHGKSATASEKFPAWYLGRNPEKRVILASYGDDLARDFGRKNRNDLEAFGQDIFGITVAVDSSAANRWDLAGHRGGMIAAGVGGPITGRGSHLFVIDDPFKDWEQSQSLALRDRVWNWYRSVAHTRLQKGGAIIVIQTRWHEDDLAGHLLADAAAGLGDKWDVLSLPCEAEADDPLGRAIGEPLWPEGGFDAEWMAAKKLAVGAQIWAALYQQRPSPAEGGIFKRFWWRFWAPKDVIVPTVTLKAADGSTFEVKAIPEPEYFDRKIQSWDLTFKDKRDSAFAVGQVWATRGANKFLLDQVRDRMDFVATIKAIKMLSAKHQDVTEKLIEDKANGPAVISALRDEISGIIPIEPRGSKEARAHAVSPLVEAGNVFLPHPSLAPWVWAFIEETAAFPNSAYKDMTDTMTQALDRLEHTQALTIMTWQFNLGKQESYWRALR